ncbi:MAG: gamma-glutamyl-gamma-aminobutyrate hydrolase family protein [Clostridia bacterium]|nr:gamma-glutamyl-gamma-aminobutyrate hydrolase family protein [Clostridia bacterium]
MHETRTGHTNVLTREEWLRQGKKHPLIGVTALYDAELESLWMMPAYLERIREAGGTPILLPMTADESEIAQLVSVLDGILFAGGQDVSPALYETTDETGTVQPCPQRDAFEPTLLRLALKKDLPVFGICRGLQLINACCGGDLYQDLPLQRPSDVCHRQERPYTDPVHTVTLTADGGLRALLGTETLAVNSCHHQAIRTLAPGFRATAITPDGLMEAIEKPDAPFVWAVQWHPEMLSQSDAASRKLFERFVQACRERANRA